jgi:hypothetical protein
VTFDERIKVDKKKGGVIYEELVVLFVAITFLATFTLTGCNINQRPHRRREILEYLEHLEHRSLEQLKPAVLWQWR